MAGKAGGVRKFRQGLIKGLEFGLGGMLVALILLEVVQVFLRYFLAEGLIWGRDTSTLLLFCIAWIGAPLGWLNGNYIAVDLFPGSRFGRRSTKTVLNLIMVAFAIALAAITMQAIEAFSFIELPSLGVSAAIKFVPIVAGAALLIIASVLNLVDEFDDRQAAR